MAMKNYTIRFIQPWVFFAILVGGLFLCFGSVLLLPRGIEINKLLCIAWVSIWGVIGYWLFKKIAVRELIVTLTAEALLIQTSSSVVKQQIPLNQIASYVYHDYNDNKHLIFRLHSGRKIAVRHQGALCADDDITALAADFETQRIVSSSSVNALERMFIKREKSFFEKPVADVLGWIIVVFLICITGYLLVNGAKIEKWGSVFMIYSNGLAYLGAWWNARRVRSEV